MIQPYIYGDVLDLGCGDAFILREFQTLSIIIIAVLNGV